VSSNLLWRHGRHWNLLRHNFVDFPTLRNDMVVEMGHDIGATVHCWRGLVLRKVRNPIATKAADLMLVYDAGVGFLVGFDKKALEVCYKVKFEWVLFILVFKV